MDNDDFFDGLSPEAETVPTEQVITEPQATEAAPPPVVEAPAAEVPPAPEPEAKPEPGHVPITALLDEREKRKELEKQVAAMREAQVQQPVLPDPTADPYAYQQAIMQQVQQQVLDTRLNMSETAARRHYGNDLTTQAKEWALSRFQSNPAFQQEVIGNPDPYGYAIEAYQRDQIASQVTPTDFEQFKAWQAAQAQIAGQPVAAAAPPIAAAPPRSIASAPSAGGVAHEPVDPESGYAAAIP